MQENRHNRIPPSVASCSISQALVTDCEADESTMLMPEKEIPIGERSMVAHSELHNHLLQRHQTPSKALILAPNIAANPFMQ